ncbi:hypothetical protein EC973_008868 [Apophysomyces ossiformis]|uniref:Stress-response A/B barrel domain-containing protein n=1 Tax=Apophysomyces ossiformis TaxID=679940 RepID=A0A8H7EVB7_9FUNG|nr:hypothetical protein EC973_008868 [Apophysomyces ossiformis]
MVKVTNSWTKVLVKFKPEVDESLKQEAINEILALKDKIPEIKKATAGVNFTDRSKGFTHGWVIEVESKEHLTIYNEHEHHVAFVTKFRPLLADLVAVDYES